MVDTQVYPYTGTPHTQVTYTHIYTYIHTYTYIYIYIHIHTHTYIYIHNGEGDRITLCQDGLPYAKYSKLSGRAGCYLYHECFVNALALTTSHLVTRCASEA